MQKRGQVTTFVIIAIIVVAVVLLGVFLWPQISERFMSEERASEVLASKSDSLRDAVEDCVKLVSEDFFHDMGLQGGYYDTTGLDNLYYADNFFTVVMFKNSNNKRVNKLPLLGQMAYQYQLFLDTEGNAAIDRCLNDFSSFEKTIDVTPGVRTITPIVYYDAVILDVDWPISVSKQSAKKKVTQTINQKSIILMIPLGNMWNVANMIVDCEVKPGCKYEAVIWDEMIWDYPFDMQYISKEARRVNKDQIVFFLESVPYRPGEESFKFNFAIDRS